MALFKKYLVIASKDDKAGMNITTELFQYIDQFQSDNIKFYRTEGSILDEKNLDLERINSFDFVIFASRHKSEKSEKTISIHSPGNFKEVWGGGQTGKLSPSSALFNKHLYEKLDKTMKEHKVTNYNLTLEVTHHGPLINKPCVFLEIGGSEIEWKDKRAAFIVAKALKESIDTFQGNPYREVGIGIGGPHYCPVFNKIQENSNVALSHIIPNYVQPITAEMINEALEKTIEEVDFAVVDWKGLGTAEERDRVIKILEENYVEWRKTSEVKK
jgi:D-aminoacyl-tRNA deacylase